MYVMSNRATSEIFRPKNEEKAPKKVPFSLLYRTFAKTYQIDGHVPWRGYRTYMGLDLRAFELGFARQSDDDVVRHALRWFGKTRVHFLLIQNEGADGEHGQNCERCKLEKF